MRSEKSPRALRPLVRVIASAFALVLGCGGATKDPDDGGPPGSSGGTSNGGSAGSSGGTSNGGSAGSSGGAPDHDVDKVDIGECVFADPGVELQVRYQILQADQLDGALDGSVGPEAVTYLSVSQDALSLSGLECLTNLERLSLSVYGEGGPPVSLAPIAGLSHLRRLGLYGSFEIAGALDTLSLETLDLTGVALTDLDEVSAQTELRELRLAAVPLTRLKGAEQLAALESLSIEGAKLTDLAPLGATSKLTYLELDDIPGLTSLKGIEPHTGLKQLLAFEVPLESLIPFAGATALESVGVYTSELSSLEGLEGKVGLDSVTVTAAKLSDLSALSGLPALRYLNLSDNAIDDLSALSTCTALTHLDITGNAVQSLAPLEFLVLLGSLQAGNNALTSIDVDLPDSLTSLTIANNQVSSLAPLAGLGIEHLDISSTPLESLAPLFDLPQLVSLFANDIGATNLSAFPLAQLDHLSVQNNQIESVAELHGLGQISVDLTANQIVSLPADFVGPSAQCGGLVLLENPLDEAAKSRLEILCEEGGSSYSWDGGECDFCPRV